MKLLPQSQGWKQKRKTQPMLLKSYWAQPKAQHRKKFNLHKRRNRSLCHLKQRHCYKGKLLMSDELVETPAIEETTVDQVETVETPDTSEAQNTDVAAEGEAEPQGQEPKKEL